MSQQSVKEAIQQTAAAVEADASAGKVKYHATTQWEEDVRCTANVRDFETMTSMNQRHSVEVIRP
jgi:hypothetical protein